MEEGWFVVCLLSFLVLLPLFKIRSNWRFSWLELYLMGTMVTLALLSATSAARVFGQPLLYGILAKRSVILLGTWILLLNAWRRHWIDAQDLQKSLLCVVWFVAILYGCMQLFLNPANFTSAPIGFLLSFGQEQSFSVPGYLLPFGTLYYLLQGLRRGTLHSYFLGIFIFLINAGSSWRTLTLSLSVTFLIFLLLWKPFGSSILLLLRLAVVAAMAFAVAHAIRPAAVENATKHLRDALQVASGQGPGDDPSANARIEETQTALPYVRAHPLLGAGLLSVQWRGGPLGLLGVYFSDSDIGLLGIVFSYGLLGLLIGLYQYRFALQAALRYRHLQQSSFQDGALGYIVYSFLFSLPTGLFMTGIESTTFFIVLFYGLSRPDVYPALLARTIDVREPVAVAV